jgi:hypothetical protein
MNAMSELSIASEEVRKDLRTATIVQHAMTLMSLAGAAEAAHYLRYHQVPPEVIERVLMSGSCRQPSRSPLVSVPTVVQTT